MRLKVNGAEAEIPPHMRDDRLLWILRDHFRLNGPKYGCGAGTCGACTIHVDGEAQRSCLMAGRDVAGREVTTLEGLASRDGSLHPVQQSWIDLRVPQCGYCQNGQIMTAAALLHGRPQATPQEIADVMDDVICRCGTHRRIREAIAHAQKMIGGDA